MIDETYNGWTNRETWAAALHIDNDEVFHNWRNMLCRDALVLAAKPSDYPMSARVELGQSLRSWCEDMLNTVFHTPDETTKEMRMMACDVGSLWRVNWDEIAKNWLEDFDVEDVA